MTTHSHHHHCYLFAFAVSILISTTFASVSACLFPNASSIPLKAIVRAYQKNFNLNIIVILVNTTLGQIVQPCYGVIDVINNTTSMYSDEGNATISSDDTLKFHTISHLTFFPDMPLWLEGTQELTYVFDPDNDLDDIVMGPWRWASREINWCTHSRQQARGSI